MNQHTTEYLILTALLTVAPLAAAETVARWVDADGVTHFGDVQLAPAHAAREDIGPANAMDPLEVRGTDTAGSGPSWNLIDLPPKQNPKGWRAKGQGVRNGPIAHGR